MASPWFATVKSPSASGFLLILPVQGQKVKCVSPGAFKVLLRSREKEPTRPADRTVIAACFRHEIYTRLQKLQSLCRGDIGA